MNVSLDGLEYYKGQMSGDKVAVFNENTGVAVLSNMRFNAQGMVILKIKVTSDPAEYSLETEILINVRKMNLLGQSLNNGSRIELLFEADYDAIVGSSYLLQFQSMMGNYLSGLYPNIILNTVTITKGQFCGKPGSKLHLSVYRVTVVVWPCLYFPSKFTYLPKYNVFTSGYTLINMKIFLFNFTQH